MCIKGSVVANACQIRWIQLSTAVSEDCISFGAISSHNSLNCILL